MPTASGEQHEPSTIPQSKTDPNLPPTEYYIYQGLNPVEEVTPSETPIADYLFGPGIDEPLAMTRGGQVYYYDVDDLGSVILVNDGGGTVQDSYIYDSWGVVSSQTGSLGNPFGYTAREFGDTGADWFYRARYYSPGNASFLSSDPLYGLIPTEGPTPLGIGAGVYTYTHSKPITRRDPLGLWDELPCWEKIPRGKLPCAARCWWGYQAFKCALSNQGTDELQLIDTASSAISFGKKGSTMAGKCIDALEAGESGIPRLFDDVELSKLYRGCLNKCRACGNGECPKLPVFYTGGNYRSPINFP